MIVNVRSGMAAMASKKHPGSVSDIEVLRRHAAEVNEMVGESKMLADKGYRCDPLVPNCQVVSNENLAEMNARLIVERFFRAPEKPFHRLFKEMGTFPETPLCSSISHAPSST